MSPSLSPLIDEQFELISAHVEELRRLKSEGKISNEEFMRRIKENKEKLDELIYKVAYNG